MATSKIQPKGGGGGVNYVRLWTNPSPMNSYTNTPATLSMDITNFDGFRIVWKSLNTDAIDLDAWDESNYAYSATYDIPSSQYSKYTSSGNGRFSIATYRSKVYARTAFFSNTTTMGFTYARTQDSDAVSSTTYCIPLFIDGVTYV